MIFRVAIFCLLTLSPAAVHAEPPLQSALAMHGAPKEAENFQHLDYANPAAPKGGTLRRAETGSFDNLNGFLLQGKAPAGLELTYDPLMQRAWNEPFTLYGLVAEKIRVASDRSWIVFYLNPHARFHDGTPITADDVINTITLLKKHGRPNQRAVFKLVQSTTALDDRTVRVDFAPGFNRETVMIVAKMPVLSKAYWAAHDFTKTTLVPPLASGPYRIASVEPGRRITYERVQDYWAKDLPLNRGLFNFDRITYDYYRDDRIALQAFGANAFDVRVENSPLAWQRDYNFTGIATGDIVKQEFPNGRPQWARFITFNLRRAPFDDLRVRQALVLAFDFDWLNRTLFQNSYVRQDSVFANSVLAQQGEASDAERALLQPYLQDLPPDVLEPYQAPRTSGRGITALRPNLKRAVALLNAAGYDWRDGQMAKDGKALAFEILLNDAGDERIALEYARALKRIGVAVTLHTAETAQYIARTGDFDFDATFMLWKNTLSPGTEQYVYWGSRAAATSGSFNYSGLASPALDALLDRLVRTTDYAALVTVARAMDRVVMHAVIGVPLYYTPVDRVAYRRTLGHPATTPIFGPILETWWQNPAQSAGLPDMLKKK